MRDQLLRRALAHLESTANDEETASVLAELGPHLSRRQLREVLSALRFVDDDVAALQLATLAPWVAANLPTQTLDAVHLIIDLNIRNSVFKALLPHWKKADRNAIAARIATRYLSSEEFTASVNAANSIVSASERSEAYSRLSPKLNDEQLSIILKEISKIGDEHVRMTVIRGQGGYGALLDHLGKRLPDQLLAIVSTFRDEQSRAPVIWSLSRVLPREYLKTLLSAAAQLKDDRLRGLLFGEGSTATLMQAEPEASVALALSVENDAALASALHSIAFHEVPPHLIEAVISASSRLNDDEARSLLFALLSKTGLSERQRVQALEAMSAIVDKVQLAEMFAAMGRPATLATSRSEVPVPAGKRKSRSALALVKEDGKLNPAKVERNILAAKIAALGSLGQTTNDETYTGEQTEGLLHNADDLEEGLRQYFSRSGVPDAQMFDAIAQAERIVVRAKVRACPKWDERSNELGYLTAPLYLKKIYSFLFDPSGKVMHEDLLREHDPKLLHLVQQYIATHLARIGRPRRCRGNSA